MPRYVVSLYYTTWVDHEVEAADADEAQEKALLIEEPIDTFSQKVLEHLEFDDCFVREEVNHE